MLMSRAIRLSILALAVAAAAPPAMAADQLIGSEVSADRAKAHFSGEARVLQGQIRHTPGGVPYVTMLTVPDSEDLGAVVALVKTGVDLADLAAVTLLEEAGPTTIQVGAQASLDGLFGRAIAAPLEGRTTLAAQWEYMPGRQVQVDIVRLVPRGQRGFGFPYVIPSERVPVLDLFRDFFWSLSNRLAVGDPATNVHWAAFLRELAVKVGSPAEAALVRASLAYKDSRPTPAEHEAFDVRMQALVDDEEAYEAALYRWELDQALREARIVRTLGEELQAAGSSLDGILEYLEVTVRPNVIPVTDKPDGDPEYFELGVSFCREARIDCPELEGAR